MSIFKQKEITTEEAQKLFYDLGKEIEEKGIDKLKAEWRRDDKISAWLGFIVCLIPFISIALFIFFPWIFALAVTLIIIAIVLYFILR